MSRHTISFKERDGRVKRLTFNSSQEIPPEVVDKVIKQVCSSIFAGVGMLSLMAFIRPYIGG